MDLKQNSTKKILVAFYSRDGHTKKAAELIAEHLNADIDEIEDKKSRKGFIRFLIAGYDATRGKTTEITFSKDPSDYDIVIIGSPVWNGRITPAVRTYLLKNKEKIKKSCFFVTCAAKDRKALSQMNEIYGGEVLSKKVLTRKTLEEEARELAEELKSII